ncbi:Zn-dependent M28 family amino/carboxypeptidase [Luteimonas cucumeris]|uniref:Carboxypeptidase Q n=1 Tax=Luteimonas cucumeris TaxID=985012 RepID=A0A562LF72_9GAMM|nr:M28 family peptidase [Luteimonas cucumeris]TWI06260.1 Zn-dependent M28 family amino/carboxypeptidase [Luteimonas cucumeris]
MRLSLSITALALAIAASSAFAADKQTTIPQTAVAQVPQLREQALASDLGWKITESLTTEVGARLPGTEADARAVEWAVAKFKELGYDKVWTEPVTFPKWVRRSESGEVLGAHAQHLVLTALGGSPGGTVETEVVRFADLAALQAAPEGSLAGKIAFVDYQMKKTQDGSDYRHGGGIRGRGPTVASSKGASAFLMRSAGTASHRVAHTGGTRFADGVKPIPSAALSLPDADQLARLVKLGPTKVRIALDVGFDGEYTSQNVIGEITGSSRPDEVVLIGGHLDSWDHGTGAIDDAAGIGITMAAAALIKPLKPARTLRVVAFANEEQGLFGGRAYADKYFKDVARHHIAAESDFGAGRIYAFDSSAPAYAKPAVEQIAKALAPLGIEYTPGEGGPESDIGPLAARGMAWGSLSHDGTDYFDLHHNADDTLDKIDPKVLAQNVAAYTVFTWLAAQSDGDFGSAPKAAEPRGGE